MTNRNTEGLKQYAAEKSHSSFKKAITAIKTLSDANLPVTFATVARQAKVSRTYLYRQPELCTVISNHRIDYLQSHDLLLTNVINMQKIEIARLQQENKQLQEKVDLVIALEKENAELKKQLRSAYKY